MAKDLGNAVHLATGSDEGPFPPAYNLVLTDGARGVRFGNKLDLGYTIRLDRRVADDSISRAHHRAWTDDERGARVEKKAEHVDIMVKMMSGL